MNDARLNLTANILAAALCLVVAVFGMSSCGKGGATAERRQYYAMLDSTLGHDKEYEAALVARLEGLKNNAATTESTDARYFYNKLIAEGYLFYIPDSALVYLDKNRELAHEFRRDDWRAETEITRASLQVNGGMLNDARQTLDYISDKPMTRENRMNYYVEEMHYWNYYAIYRHLQQPEEHAMAFADSLIALTADPQSPYTMLARMYAAAPLRGENYTQDLMDYVDRMDPDDLWYGQLAMNAGLFAGFNDDRDDQLKFYVEGLCYDIRHVSRHLLMLASVARMAVEDGELDYASRFYNVTQQVQRDYPERIHNSRGELQDDYMQFHDAVMRQIQAQQQRGRVLLVIISVLAVVACALLAYSLLQIRRKNTMHRRLEASLKELEDSHVEMKQLLDTLRQKDAELRGKNAELGQTNAQLAEANYVKEAYIGQMFATCSEYLDKMNKLRQTLNRKLRAGQYEDAIRLTDTKDARDSGELQELWARFDEVFLGLFPDFISQFNSLLQPDKQITLRKGERMNTDLRIYALIRLGISSSVKIGRILGISSQTVYNATMKMRSRAADPEADFNASVRQLKGIKIDIATAED